MEKTEGELHCQRVTWIQGDQAEEFEKRSAAGAEGPQLIWVQSTRKQADPKDQGETQYRRQPARGQSREPEPYRGQPSPGSREEIQYRPQMPKSQGEAQYRRQPARGQGREPELHRGQPSLGSREEIQYRPQMPKSQGEAQYRRQPARGQSREREPYRGQPSPGGREEIQYRPQMPKSQGEAQYRRQPARGQSREMEQRNMVSGSSYAMNTEISPVKERKNRTGNAKQESRPEKSAGKKKAHGRGQIILAAVKILGIVGIGFFLALLVRGMADRKVGSEEKMVSGTEEKIVGDVEQGGSSNAQGKESDNLIQGISADIYALHPEWEENFLTPNEYSRPGNPLTEVKNIFVHYTANPGTSAVQNRSYFEQQKDTHENSVSSHFIIGYDGEILQIIPLDEIAYAVKTRNMDSISVECCYREENGQFTKETYDSLIALLSWLTKAYGLDSEDILRHYDCGGKKCPLYYTEHEDAWEQLKEDVKNYTA